MKTLERAMKVVPPGEGEIYHVLGERMQCKMKAADTHGDFSFLEVASPPGGGAPLHVHHREDEAFYVLEGEYELQIGAEKFMAFAGDFAYFPKGVPHAYTNAGTSTGRMLITITPGGFEEFFGEITELGDGPPDFVKVMEIAGRYEVDILPPSFPVSEAFFNERPPLLLRAGEGETLQTVPGDSICLKAVGEATGGLATIFAGRISPQAGPPLHVHHREDEAFYIQEGSFTYQVGETVVLATAGTFLYAPRDIPHSFKNAGDTEGRIFTLATPSGIEGFFRELSSIDFRFPTAMERAIEVGLKYGSELLAPRPRA